MARLRLDPCDHYPFATEFTVRAGDVNIARHLGHDQLIALLNEARVRFFAHCGIDGMDVAGRMLFVADLAAVYLSEAGHGDRLQVEVATRDWNRYGCDIVFRVTQKDSGREVARAKTGMVAVDPGSHRPAPVPDSLRERLEALRGSAESSKVKAERGGCFRI